MGRVWKNINYEKIKLLKQRAQECARLGLPHSDHALSASGLLVDHLGGESVKPYQPPGLWGEVVFTNVPRFQQDHGKKLYRRSMYTYWKRSVPPPNMQVFDAPSREVCVLKRPSTNTPLAALVLMNDPTFVEASRKLAERVLREALSNLSLIHI